MGFRCSFHFIKVNWIYYEPKQYQGLCPANLKSLEKKVLTEIELLALYFRNCPICLEDFQINDEITYLKCLHYYHSNCIREWLENRKTCPFCSSET